MDALLIARLNATNGRTEEFEHWYTHVHLRDALRMRGCVAAQRFRRYPAHCGERSGFAYLTVYDVDRPEQFARAHDDAAATGALVMSSAADLTEVSVHHYYPRTVLHGERGSAATSALLAEFEEATPTACSEAEDLLSAAWAAVTAVERRRGFVATYERRAQMFRRPPGSRLLCLAEFGCTPAELADQVLPVLSNLPHGPRVTLFEQASPVLTKDQVAAEGVTSMERQARRRALADPADGWGGSARRAGTRPPVPTRREG
jgi:hypothetical protein